MFFPIGQPSGLRFASQSQDNLPIGVWGLCAPKHILFFLRPKQPPPGSGPLSSFSTGPRDPCLCHPLGIRIGVVAYFGGRRTQVDRLQKDVAQKPRLSTRAWLRSRGASYLRASEEIPFFLAPLPAHFKPCLLRVAGEVGSLGFQREGECDCLDCHPCVICLQQGPGGQG